MGDPRHAKKQYSKPRVPWQSDRLNEERGYMQRFGLRRKKEVYRAESKLKKYKEVAKRLVGKEDAQSLKEKEQLFSTLQKYGLLQEPTLTSVLSISLEQILERRLQSQLVHKDLAASVKQARQLIVHRHVTVGGKKVSSPGYLVTVEEESTVAFHPTSPYADEDHPERYMPKPVPTANDEKEEEE